MNVRQRSQSIEKRIEDALNERRLDDAIQMASSRKNVFMRASVRERAFQEMLQKDNVSLAFVRIQSGVERVSTELFQQALKSGAIGIVNLCASQMTPKRIQVQARAFAQKNYKDLCEKNINWLAEHAPEILTQIDAKGNTLLHRACENENRNCLLFLLQTGVLDVDKKNKAGKTCLDIILGKELASIEYYKRSKCSLPPNLFALAPYAGTQLTSAASDAWKKEVSEGYSLRSEEFIKILVRAGACFKQEETKKERASVYLAQIKFEIEAVYEKIMDLIRSCKEQQREEI